MQTICELWWCDRPLSAYDFLRRPISNSEYHLRVIERRYYYQHLPLFKKSKLQSPPMIEPVCKLTNQIDLFLYNSRFLLIQRLWIRLGLKDFKIKSIQPGALSTCPAAVSLFTVSFALIRKKGDRIRVKRNLTIWLVYMETWSWRIIYLWIRIERSPNYSISIRETRSSGVSGETVSEKQLNSERSDLLYQHLASNYKMTRKIVTNKSKGPSSG